MTNDIIREEALQQAAKKLDIPPSKYKQAMERFDTMHDYLSDGDYAGATPPHDIYLQGSFKLGTEIRPYRGSKDADYDIDVVCCLGHQQENITPSTVKHQVGNRLKVYYDNMMDDEGKRCWTINYAEDDNIGFHVDIVPSIPKISNDNSISITNKDVNNNYEWSPSNPKDFADWFYRKNAHAFDAMKDNQKLTIFKANVQDGLFLNRYGIRSIDEVPNIHVKTPLQRAIQLLKRHRDISFSEKDNENCKPISMIITVLAAEIYQGEETIYATLYNMINRLSEHANQMHPGFFFDSARATSTYRLITKRADGTWYIPNPTNCDENFADKWHNTENGVPHARAKAFFDWIEWLRDDFINMNVLLGEESYLRARPSWRLPSICSVKISGKFKKRGAAWQKFAPNEPLDKYCNLKFFAETDIAKPFQVHWQVVNTGKDAIDAKGLRGDIIPSKTYGGGGLHTYNNLEQQEYTRYLGTHWIRCFIIKDDACVAYSHKFLVKIRQ